MKRKFVLAGAFSTILIGSVLMFTGIVVSLSLGNPLLIILPFIGVGINLVGSAIWMTVDVDEDKHWER